MTTEFIISGVIGLLTGAIGSLVAPWMNWGIKKREMKFQKKTELLNAVRNNIDFSINFSYSSFNETSLYSQIKPYLDNKIITKINSSSKMNMMGLLKSENQKNELLEIINQLEKKWKII